MYIDRSTLRRLTETANMIGGNADDLTEGYEGKIIGYLRDAGFARDEAQFEGGVLYVTKRNLVARAERILKKRKDIHELPKIVFKEEVDGLTEERGTKIVVDPKKFGIPFDGKVVKGLTRMEFMERIFTKTPSGGGKFNVSFVDKTHEDRMFITKDGLWKRFLEAYLETSQLPSGGHAGSFRVVRVNGKLYAPSGTSAAVYWKSAAEDIIHSGDCITEAGMGDAYMRQVAERNYRKALDAYTHYIDAGLQNPKRLREIEIELDRATERCEKMGLKCGKGIKESVQPKESMVFSPSQLHQLKVAYGKNPNMKVDPNNPTYQKLLQKLDSLDYNELKQLADAGIPLVSHLCRNRLRNMKA